MRKISQHISNQSTGTLKRNAATIADDHLSQLAFDNVAQANIIIIVNSGQIIMVNNACGKLLGYSKKELLTKNRADIFDVTESNFKKMLKQRTAEGKSRALVTAIKKNGKFISCEITSAVFTGADGIIKSITTITDITQRLQDQKNIDTEKDKIVAGNIIIAKEKQKKIDVKKNKVIADNIVIARSKQKKIDIKNEKAVAVNIITAQTISDEKLADNNKWIKYIAETSYDVMWDWDIASSEIYVGQSIRELFGYKVKNNRMVFADFCKCLIDEEKESVQEKLKQALASGKRTWNDSFMFKRKDGSVAFTICRACIVRDDTGRAIRLIGALQDISQLQELKKNMEAQVTIQLAHDEKFLLAARLSFDVIWDWDLVTNNVFIGEGFEELFGYVIKNNMGNMIADWANYMHPEDKKQISKELYDAIQSSATEWAHAYRVIRADGSIAKVYARASIIRHVNGKAYRMIGAIQDLSRQKQLEEELDHEIKLKEKQISEASEDAKEMERSNIGKELHDNINQLLGASRMFLEMAKKGGSNSAMYLSRSSEYTLTAIEEIRKLSKGLTTDTIKNLGLCIAIENLAEDMAEVNAVRISCLLNGFNEKAATDKFKLNILRMVQEHLNNILKHAKATEVIIRLSQDEYKVELNITDNGIGFDTQKKQNGIGIDNIKSRAIAYNGLASFVSQPGSGCVLTVNFPVTSR
jgi:PAS domain S-box-containing protein